MPKKQFVDDIRENSDTHVSKLRKALLVLHSPIDKTVSIKQAEQIFVAAKHPKSFISLDSADHLLSKKTDAEYAAKTIAGWASRYVLEQKAQPVEKVSTGHLLVTERDRCTPTGRSGRLKTLVLNYPTRVSTEKTALSVTKLTGRSM